MTDIASEAPIADAPPAAAPEPIASEVKGRITADSDGPRDLDAPSYAHDDVRTKDDAPADEELAAPVKAVRPPDMPRSWSNSDIAEWNALTPGQKETISRREEQREQYVNQQRSTIDKARKAFEAEASQVKELRQHHEAVARDLLHSLEPKLAEFQHIRSEEDFRRLTAENPAKAAELESLLTRIGQARGVAQAAAQTRQAEQQKTIAAHIEQQQRALDDWSAAENEKFVEAHPELKDPARSLEWARTELLPYFEAQGVTKERVAELWHKVPEFRSAEMQNIFYDAAKWHAAQQKAQRAVPRAQPKPLGPGTNNAPGGGDSLEAIARKGDMKAYIRARNSGKVR